MKPNTMKRPIQEQMNVEKCKLHRVTSQYLPLYLLAGMIALWMRHISKTNDSDVILWILAPTARWASILSGISFEYIPHMGYVNHAYEFLIAPACSGIRFMLLTFLMLIFSFLHPYASTDAQPSGYHWLWFSFSIPYSYLATICVNGIRISASILLPPVFERLSLINGWLTQERLHTIIGTTIYFSCLYGIYRIAARIMQAMAPHTRHCFSSQLLKTIAPAFWYLMIVLAVPFLGRIYRNEWDGFGAYVALILGVCLVITLIRQIISLILKCTNVSNK